MFDPKPEYEVVQDSIPVRDFYDYWEEFVVRPPYQRKSVWGRGKQQALLDSLFRRYYVPRIVVREVRLDGNRTVREVVDGQQRITTAKDFLADEIPLPKTLSDVHPDLAGKKYSELEADLRRFVDRDLKYTADIVKGIEDPHDVNHQKVAAEIFWRLQQGESLTYMEIAHSRLASVTRNFVTKYADDIAFDFEAYRATDHNPSKHRFFQVIGRANDRMQHLALLSRLLLIEQADGPTDIRDTEVSELIDTHQVPDGIGNFSFEAEPTAQRTLRYMGQFYDVFKDDPMLGEGEGGGGVRELRIEYFIVSMYLLLRHLTTYYVVDEDFRPLFRDFVVEFHQRWSARDEGDADILAFSSARQQTGSEIEARDRIARQLFFEWVRDRGDVVKTKDERRGFSEVERIAIYRRDNGLCQACLAEEKPELEARVPWREYDADHVIPHSRGGETAPWNGQVLCRYHNRSKGATMAASTPA